MNFSLVINQILVLFIIIFIGYILKKRNHIDEKLNQGLSRLLVEVTMPALIISSMNVKINSSLISKIKLTVILTIIIYIFLILFSNLITKFLSISSSHKKVFIFAIIFGNVGFMGFPVLESIYPEFGIFYGLFNNIAFNILIWTYGIYLFTSDPEKEGKIRWKQLLNNGIFATIIGFIILLTGLDLPVPISGAIDYLGNMTFPLSMLIIGSSLANIRFKNIVTDKYLILFSGIKLLLIPLLFFFILKQFQIPSIVNNINIILLAMPSAANTVVFAERYGGDDEFASEIVFITTLLSLFTIPLFVSLL
ncbi:MAG: AEC family transporter [Bacillota bacterium]